MVPPPGPTVRTWSYGRLAMKMDVGIALPKIALVAIALVVVISLVLVAWIGGELHYGNCVAEAELEGKTVADCSRWP